MRAVLGAAATLLLCLATPAHPADVPLPPPPKGLQDAPSWAVGARLGTGHWTESGTDTANPDFTGGLTGEWSPAARHALRLELEGDRYRRTYALGGVDPATGAGPRRTVDESRWTARLTYGFDLLPRASDAGLGLSLLVGGGWVRFDDPVAAVGAIPLGAGFRLVRPLSSAVDARLEGFYGWAVGAGAPGAASVYGKLKADASYALMASWLLAGGRVAAGYRGETLVFEHDYRLLHTLVVEIGLGQ
ncbi:MAG TPA: hypothetical protein VFP50_04530 [Anaeromyxobacteraceae bacterium]|nr:hypothetical protein [Anaeromyxobacteraceae bacterium]